MTGPLTASAFLSALEARRSETERLDEATRVALRARGRGPAPSEQPSRGRGTDVDGR